MGAVEPSRAGEGERPGEVALALGRRHLDGREPRIDWLPLVTCVGACEWTIEFAGCPRGRGLPAPGGGGAGADPSFLPVVCGAHPAREHSGDAARGCWRRPAQPRREWGSPARRVPYSSRRPAGPAAVRYPHSGLGAKALVQEAFAGSSLLKVSTFVESLTGDNTVGNLKTFLTPGDIEGIFLRAICWISSPIQLRK